MLDNMVCMQVQAKIFCQGCKTESKYFWKINDLL